MLHILGQQVEKYFRRKQMKVKKQLIMAAGMVGILWAANAWAAASVEFSDPAKDDFGPGTYTYPTSQEYVKGAFDIQKVAIKDKGDKLEATITIATKVTDPWNSKEWQGNGFSLQFLFLFIDTDHKAASGRTDAPPGLNVSFKPEEAWEKVVLISPQGKARLSAEIKSKAVKMKDQIVIPVRTYAQGKDIIASINKADIGTGDIATWGFQVVMQSNEGYPSATDLLTRPVNEFGGEHRFGGGNDGNCDPHAIDILVPPAKGGDDELEGQKKAMEYKCKPDGTAEQLATIPMIYPK
jgi:carbohydrate-binding DOMON domain-containing protein